MSQVKGSAITARIRYVRERFGEDGYRRLLAALSADERALIQGRILPHAWVPYDLFVDVNVEADRLFGSGDLALCYEMGRYGAELNLPTLYRLFLQFGSPMLLFRKAARLWEVHYDSGTLTPIEEGNGGRLRVAGFARPHRAHCLSVLGWAARSVELCGATIESAEHTSCRLDHGEACEFVFRWQ